MGIFIDDNVVPLSRSNSRDWIYALMTVAESLIRNVVVVFGDCSVANVEFDFGLGLLVVVVVMEEILSM